MDFNTGQTIVEMVESLDGDFNVFSASTFSQVFFIDGVLTLTPVVNITLQDPSTAIFSASFSASTYGIHQFQLRNSITNTIYFSNAYNISAVSELDKTIYIGL